MIEIIKTLENNGFVFVDVKSLFDPYEDGVEQAKLVFKYEEGKVFVVVTKPTSRVSKDRMCLDPLKEGDGKWALLAEEYVSLCEECKVLGAAIPVLPIFDDGNFYIKRRPEFLKDAAEAKKKLRFEYRDDTLYAAYCG